MNRLRTIAWWYWLITVGFLIWELASQRWGAQLAIGLCLIQILHFGRRQGSLVAFPLQVRIVYLSLLLLALWEPLRFIYWIQLIGTSAMVLINYCFLARCLSLLPWNRTEPLTLKAAMTSLFSAPTSGSVAQR